MPQAGPAGTQIFLPGRLFFEGYGGFAIGRCKKTLLPD